MCLFGLRFKKHIIFHILYIIVAPLCPIILKCAYFYKAHRSEKQGVLWLASYPVSALWLAKYLKRETEMLRPLPYCDAVSLRDDTKTIKPIINEAFVASSGDIITDYNDLYCRKTLPCLHLWSEKWQTTSATLHCSKLTFESSVANSLNMKTYLQAVSQKCQTVLAKLELPHFIETAIEHSWQATPRIRK